MSTTSDFGTSRHFAAMQDVCHFRVEADMNPAGQIGQSVANDPLADVRRAEIPQCSDLLTDPPQFDMLCRVSGSWVSG